MAGEIDFSTAKGGYAGKGEGEGERGPLRSSKSADPEYFNRQLSGRAVDTGEYL